MKCTVCAACPLAVILYVLFATSAAELECPGGWFREGSKCYKVFYGANKRAFKGAQEVCSSYGSQLVIIKNQKENDQIGAEVERLAGAGESYFIGLSMEKTNVCDVCSELRWSDGMKASDYQGFWFNTEPDDIDGDCVFSQSKLPKYVYDRPYAWSYGNCYIKRAFVCERSAAPEESFHCWHVGYVSKNKMCDGRKDCEDGSDELNCDGLCHYYHELQNGNLAPFAYTNGLTCTWAIKTPLGTSAFVTFDTFDTEYEADFVTIFVGSVIESQAKRVDQISGQLGSRTYRSYNNMMLIRFSSDSSVNANGFTGTYGSVDITTSDTVTLTTQAEPQSYAVKSFGVADTHIVIQTEESYKLRQMITLVIEDLQIRDGDYVAFFDGDSPSDQLLATNCNNEACTNYKVVYSTGNKLSIVLRTGRDVTSDVVFKFNYRRGCYYETTELWGTLFTPGFPGNINYPSVTCTWILNINQPFAIHFDPTTQFQDAPYNRTVNGDILKIYNKFGELMNNSNPEGLLSSEVADQTVINRSGYLKLVLETSVTRTAKGLLATWSIDCPNPHYNSNHTMLNRPVDYWHYTSKTEVSCPDGYDFLQHQIPHSTPSVYVECGFMGVWKNYLQIPRCTPKYCGVVPNIDNGFIDYSTGSVYGSEAVYKCYSGSTLISGNGRITCDADGEWTALPMCRSARCPDNQFDTVISHGTGKITNGNGTSIGTIYAYSCDSGFEVVGEPFVFCEQDGEWTQTSSPYCKRIKCLLPEIENGIYLGADVGDLINFEDTIQVNCNNGYSYEIGSSTSVQCQNDRAVTQLPMCINTNECEEVNKGNCADICHDTEGSYYCTCNDGYELRSDERTCQDINECHRDIDNCDGDCLNAPGSYSCSCQLPYVLYTVNMTSGYKIPQEESGILPTDVYHLNHTCVFIECPAPSPIFNGQLLKLRDNHRYGDYIEYQCDIGYTPRRTVIKCNSNGNWNDIAPTCTAAMCPTDIVGSLHQEPIYSMGPYSYGQMLTLQCDVATRQFNKTRFCTYNKETDSYALQGSPYECGVVDCGSPIPYPGTANYFITSTLYEGSFEFTCENSVRQGRTVDGPESTVQCRKDGYWDFGNLQCTGQSCLDPGTPAGGSLVEEVNSLEDNSVVRFQCDQLGYSLSHDVTFTCIGTTFNPVVSTNMPTCVDTAKPIFLNCPTLPIMVDKYSLLRDYLPPTLSVTDNTGVKSFTVDPRNANSTYRITSDRTVTYRAADFAGNAADPCIINFIIKDDEPPQITCTNVMVIELETIESTEQYEKPVQNDFDIKDNRNIKTFQINSNIPDTITFRQLYQTYTYTAYVSDQADNQATCRGQVFIQPRTCSEVSFLTPLFSQKTCTHGTSVDLSCTLRCDDAYTFEDSKSKTVQCVNDVWQDNWMPACIQDVIAPVVKCPQSRVINQLSQNTDNYTVDFTTLEGQVISTDLNTMDSPVFSPATYTFTENDLYKPNTIKVSVTDAAMNTGTCNFQYTIIPPVCSPLMLLKPKDSTVTCTRTIFPSGWNCIITCTVGKILRNTGSTDTVNCIDGNSWQIDNQFPACIDDTKAPVITEHPLSREELIANSNDSRIIEFAVAGSGYGYVANDYSGIATVDFYPPTLTVSQLILNQPQSIVMTLADLAGNQVSSSFQVIVAAEKCSPLALANPVNGKKECTETSNGYTCTLSCNPNYSLYQTASTQITSTCSNNENFDIYVPECANDYLTTMKQFIGKLRYEYRPNDSNVLNIHPSCASYYLDKLVSTNVFEEMANTLETICLLYYNNIDEADLHVQFINGNTISSILQDGQYQRLVQMDYAYTILYSGSESDVIANCANRYTAYSFNVPGTTFSLSQTIDGGVTSDGSHTCPTLTWDDIASSLSTGFYCPAPYYESLTNSNLCVRCPAGTFSNGVVCTVCPAGTYSNSTDERCMDCPTGYTTRYPGAMRLEQCIAPCSNGQVSSTGFSPCYYCSKGTYSVNTMQCTRCNTGLTTYTIGSSDVLNCIDIYVVNEVSELCSIGTEDIGNNTCQLCAIGEYRSSFTQTCVSCVGSTTTYFEGATSNNQCLDKCGDGFTSDTGRAPCMPCPAGQRGLNSTHCETCQAGYTTLTPGSTICILESDLIVKCPRGKFRDMNTEQCTLCPVGSYWSTEDASSCTDCEPNYSTYFEGATALSMCILKCEPGFYSLDGTGMSPCRACGTGRYSDVYGANECSDCDPGETTITTTSTSLSNCIQKCGAGYYSYNGYSRPNACDPCPTNHYQPQIGSTQCIQCPGSQYTTNSGSTTSCLSAVNLCDNYCQNTGTCTILDNEPVCHCPEGEYSGPTCSVPVNACASSPCYNNGACTQTAAGEYECSCTGATGSRCETITKLCDTSQVNPTCENGGDCINTLGGYECFCREGFTGNTCRDKASICVTKPCMTGGTQTCEDVSLGSNLRRRCICSPGWTGEDCQTEINECDSNPCINGATCVDLVDLFRCDCQPPYTGTFCQNRLDMCVSMQCGNNGDTLAECVDVHGLDRDGCICSPGYTYDRDGYTQYEIMVNRAPDNLVSMSAESQTTLLECSDACTGTTNCNRFAFDIMNNKCYIWNAGEELNVISHSNVYMYTKHVIYPQDDFYTLRYNLKTPDNNGDRESLSDLNNIYGLNICGGTVPLYTTCCRAGDTCLETVDTQVCSDDGVRSFSQFVNYYVQFKCSINRVFQNNICSAKADYCSSSPCENGQCDNIFGGYTCTCTHGYVGKNCQTDYNYCAFRNPCNNGGVCEDTLENYSCLCALGYEGHTCDNPVNFCENDNCNTTNGFCNLEQTGYTCTCYAGYGGTYCDDYIDHCKSEPCKHGGDCESVLNGYRCTCVEGYQGTTCEIVIEYCSMQQGSQCQGNCNNIFNSYYCSCGDNTYGTNCENQPNPCRDYKKCQNDAICTYDTNMTCTCPSKFTGDGCEILINYCGSTNPCQNDATCSVTDAGYKCTCKPGYIGTNCETDIDECASVTCPGDGVCFDDTDKYYCSCPLKKTGNNCNRDYDRNYDLYFNRGHAWITHKVNNANEMTVSLWVRYVNSGTSGVYFSDFMGNRIETSVRWNEFNEIGVKTYIPNTGAGYIQLEYSREARVNDGNWHFVVFVCDMVAGKVKLYLDTVYHDEKTHSGLIMPATTTRVWSVLGCNYNNEARECYSDGYEFHGYLSQVNRYKSELSFQIDIPYKFANPQHIYETSGYNLIQVWNGYQLETGVSRLIPSEAQGTNCDIVGRTPPCNFYTASTLPTVSNCPGDQFVHSTDRTISVDWTEPTFDNLGSRGYTTRPDRQPRSTFTWGVHDILYVGVDSVENRVFCHFRIYVNDGEQCQSPPDPYGGTQDCIVDNLSGRKGCMISCNNPTNYLIDRDSPELFTCGPSGTWNSQKPFQTFRYPSCGIIMPEPKVNVYMYVVYHIGTTACDAVKRNVQIRTLEEFVELQNIYQGDLCQDNSCSQVKIELSCNKASRYKRQTVSEYTTVVEIWLKDVTARTMLDQEDISVEEFLTYFILGADVLNFKSTVVNATIEKQRFEIVVTPTCPEGQILRADQCVECGPGNYFRYTDDKNTTAICDDCLLGSYQTQYGQSSCTTCKSGFTTEMTGEYEETSCKESCPVGQYFSSHENACANCSVGYYQDEVGQFRCKGCLAGFTTKEEGSVSFTQCSVSCDSGYELNDNGNCVACIVGLYRNATETRTCVPCPPKVINDQIASTSIDDCTIVACEAGTYRDVSLNVCKDCLLNSYQPMKWKTDCIPCGSLDKYRTENIGSSSISQCLFYCQSGYQATEGDHCDICPVGTYKDNNQDIQGECRPCTGNFRTPDNGSTSIYQCSIYKCPVGQKPNAVNTLCVDCPVATYQDVEYSTDCKDCVDSYSTRQLASNSSLQCELYCDSGSEKISGMCTPCQKGFFKDNADGLFEPCQNCSSRFTTVGTGSTSEDDCAIRTCPPGTKRNADDSDCDLCPIGTYQDNSFQTECIECIGEDKSTRTEGSTAITDCEVYCPSGFEKAEGICDGCERGYYKDNNEDKFSTCTLCEIEKITADINSVSADNCTIRNCSAGSYLKADNTCQLCVKGEYQPAKWTSEGCISCGVDKTTENIGADQLSDCILECRPGYEDIGGTCQECRRGFFKVENAAATCKECEIGLTTETTGATSSDQCSLPACNVGSYLDRTSSPVAPQCVACPYDQYQDDVWMEQCKECPDNIPVTLQMGSDEQTDCVADCNSGTHYNSVSGSCDFCAVGFYRDKTDRQQTQCQLCPLDKITIGKGTTDVLGCDIANCTEAGSYRDTTMNECRLCPLGEYNSGSTWWQTTCTPCPTGNSTRNVGSISIDECRSICPLGQYVATNNQCQLCPRGSYRSNRGDDVCTQCHSGLLTPGLGTDTDQQCTISPCSAGEMYVMNDLICQKCAIGKYQPDLGKFQCIDCPYPIQYTPSEGATTEDQCKSPCRAGEEFYAATRSCVPCPSGTYQPTPNKYVCTDCPGGRRYTESTGSLSIDKCLSYCASEDANDCSSNSTCTVSIANSAGYTCSCFTNYDDIGSSPGTECVHKCDRAYCKNGNACIREPQIRCTCSKWYTGEQCQSRVEAQDLSDDSWDIVIPVSITALGLILFLIILAVCCLCWRSGHTGNEMQHNNFEGERIDKTSLYSYEHGLPYGNSRPQSRIMMLAPAQEVTYDNMAYKADYAGSIALSTLDPAVYEA